MHKLITKVLPSRGQQTQGSWASKSMVCRDSSLPKVAVITNNSLLLHRRFLVMKLLQSLWFITSLHHVWEVGVSLPLYNCWTWLRKVRWHLENLTIFKKKIIMYVRSRHMTDRQSSHLVIRSPDVHNKQGWDRLKLATGNSSQVCHVGGKDPTCRLSGCELAGS